MKVKDLKKILEDVEDDLDVAALDHFGRPEPYNEYDFRVVKTHEIRPKKYLKLRSRI